MNHCKDPYKTTSIMESKRSFFVAQLIFWRFKNWKETGRWNNSQTKSYSDDVRWVNHTALIRMQILAVIHIQIYSVFTLCTYIYIYMFVSVHVWACNPVECPSGHTGKDVKFATLIFSSIALWNTRFWSLSVTAADHFHLQESSWETSEF